MKSPELKYMSTYKKNELDIRIIYRVLIKICNYKGIHNIPYI